VSKNDFKKEVEYRAQTSRVNLLVDQLYPVSNEDVAPSTSTEHTRNSEQNRNYECSRKSGGPKRTADQRYFNIEQSCSKKSRCDVPLLEWRQRRL
jgi:hypothetical protein